jgi:hypothetical protein
MAKAKRKARKQFAIEPLDLPTPEQIRNGDFERDFVTHAETNTKALTFRRRDSSIVETWVREGGPGFDHGAARVIADCQTFWQRMGVPRVTANYGERIPSSTHGEGYSQQEASDEIAYRKRLIGIPAYWDVFENCVRHNEPAGVAGSRFANNRPQQIQSAKVIVGFVASFLAAKLGY